jgi:hypothetical protein
MVAAGRQGHDRDHDWPGWAAAGAARRPERSPINGRRIGCGPLAVRRLAAGRGLPHRVSTHGPRLAHTSGRAQGPCSLFSKPKGLSPPSRRNGECHTCLSCGGVGGVVGAVGAHPVQGDGAMAGLLLVSVQPLADLECGVYVELPVLALLAGPKVAGRLRHGDHLRPVDLVGAPIGHNGRRALVKDVLQPIGALAIQKGDQELVVMMGRDDGVWYVRPDRRPIWRTIDVLDPSWPADLKASGRVARVSKRKAF